MAYFLPRVTLILGGAASGKSRFAEQMVVRSGLPRTYIATAQAFDDGDTHQAPVLAAMAKFLASDTAMKVTTDAVQLFGGYGYCKEYPVERYYRDVRVTRIYEGTSEIQRLVISRNLLKD